MLLNAGELISNKQVLYIWKKTEPIINTYGRRHYPYCLHWLVNSMLSHWCQPFEPGNKNKPKCLVIDTILSNVNKKKMHHYFVN